MTATLSYIDRPSGKQLVLLAVALGIFLTLFLGLRPLGVPSEARYAEIPREMVATGDWITPRLNGVKYFEKPPLFYWMQATALTLFGNSEWSVRIAPALMGLLGCLATYVAGCRLYGRKTAFAAALALGASPVYFAISRIALTDMAVSTFLVCCQFLFIIAVDEPEGPRRRWMFYGSYASAALAVLTKGLIGLVIPGAIVFFWLLFTRRWSLLKSFYIPTGLLLFFAIATPWHVMAGQRTPEFWWFYFVHEHFLRYSTMGAKRWEPVWFFIPIILLAFVYWVPFMFAGLKGVAMRSFKTPRLNSRDLFMWIAILFPFIFFSASKSKLPPYIVPVFPFISLVMVDWALRFCDEQKERFYRWMCWPVGVTCFLALSMGLAVFAPDTLPGIDTDDVQAIHHILPWPAAFFAIMALAQLFAQRIKRACMMVVLALVACGGLCLWGEVIAAHAQFKSVKKLAVFLKPLLKEDDVVATYWQYNQDLPFYLERIVSPVVWQGELEFGQTLEDTPWMLTDPAFDNLWHSDRRVYVFVRTRMLDKFVNDVEKNYRIIAQTSQNILLTNH